MRLLVLLLCLLATPLAAAEELRITIGSRLVRAWVPPGTGPAPVLVFSHGYGGCGGQARFLTRALADAGFLVLAPDHDDALCGRGIPGKPDIPFRYPDLWAESTYADRREDVLTILSALPRIPGIGARADLQRIGLLGHSLGGYVALGMAGAWAGWHDSRIRAVLVMSPYCTPFLQADSLPLIGVPVMYQGGSLDRPITPSVKRPGGCFDRTPSPATYVEIRGAWHLSWTWLNTSPVGRAAIAQTAIAFFQQTLNGRGEVAAVPGLSALRRK